MRTFLCFIFCLRLCNGSSSLPPNLTSSLAPNLTTNLPLPTSTEDSDYDFTCKNCDVAKNELMCRIDAGYGMKSKCYLIEDCIGDCQDEFRNCFCCPNNWNLSNNSFTCSEFWTESIKHIRTLYCANGTQPFKMCRGIPPFFSPWCGVDKENNERNCFNSPAACAAAGSCCCRTDDCNTDFMTCRDQTYSSLVPNSGAVIAPSFIVAFGVFLDIIVNAFSGVFYQVGVSVSSDICRIGKVAHKATFPAFACVLLVAIVSGGADFVAATIALDNIVVVVVVVVRHAFDAAAIIGGRKRIWPEQVEN